MIMDLILTDTFLVKPITQGLFLQIITCTSPDQLSSITHTSLTMTTNFTRHENSLYISEQIKRDRRNKTLLYFPFSLIILRVQFVILTFHMSLACALLYCVVSEIYIYIFYLYKKSKIHVGIILIPPYTTNIQLGTLQDSLYSTNGQTKTKLNSRRSKFLHHN